MRVYNFGEGEDSQENEIESYELNHLFVSILLSLPAGIPRPGFYS